MEMCRHLGKTLGKTTQYCTALGKKPDLRMVLWSKISELLALFSVIAES
jgi:hypothetical protein